MATHPPPTPEAALAAAAAAVEKGFASDYQKAATGAPGAAAPPEPTPAPEEPLKEAPPQDAPPAPAPPQDAGSPPEAAASLVDPATLDSDTLAALRHEGWKEGDPITVDLIKQLSRRYLEFNTRLADRAKAKDPQPESEEPPPEPEIDPVSLEDLEAQIQVDPQVVDRMTERILGENPEVKALETNYDGLLGEMKTLADQRTELAQKVNIAQASLSVPDIANDEFRLAEAKRELRDLRSDLRGIEADLRFKESDRREMVAKYREFRNAISSDVDRYIREKERQRLESEQAKGLEAHHTKEMRNVFFPAVNRAMVDAKIPESERDDFTEECEVRLKVMIDDSEDGLELSQVPEIVNKLAAKHKQRIDRLHRLQSAQYAELAHQRAEVPAPDATPPLVTPVGTPSTPPSADDPNFAKRVHAGFQQGLREIRQRVIGR